MSVFTHFICDVMQDAVSVRRSMAFAKQPKLKKKRDEEDIDAYYRFCVW